MILSKKKIIVISLGGSLIAPPEGFDLKFLSGFKNLVLKFIKKGFRFIIVCGGGWTSRNYQAAARQLGELTAEDIDWIGIHATRLNAHFIRTIFRRFSHPVVVKDPTRRINWKENILTASGWKPGWSTDYDAVKLAEIYGAGTVINLSNIDYVCDKDPKRFRNAKMLKRVSWPDFRKIVGDKWIPGANLPFDPVASKEAEKLGLRAAVLNGKKLKEVQKAVLGKKFLGTEIG